MQELDLLQDSSVPPGTEFWGPQWLCVPQLTPALPDVQRLQLSDPPNVLTSLLAQRRDLMATVTAAPQ